MTGRVGPHPAEALTPGRYLLDEDGRLQPLRYRAFVRVVAVVTVRAKAKPAASPYRAGKEAVARLGHDEAAVQLKPAPPKIDGARVAAAFRAKKSTPAPRKRPKRQALGPEACCYCGIPGARGCDHFVAWEAET